MTALTMEQLIKDVESYAARQLATALAEEAPVHPAPQLGHAQRMIGFEYVDGKLFIRKIDVEN